MLNNSWLAALMCIVTIVSTVGCGKKQRTASGVEYQIHTQKGGKALTEGSFVSLNMQYGTADTLLYSSYGKGHPMQFRFQNRFLNGMLNEGLLKMGEGDSATFWVVADSIYKNGLPKMLKMGDRMTYTISIQSVLTAEQFKQQNQQRQSDIAAADKQKMDAYLASDKGKDLSLDESGIAYQILLQGKGGSSPKMGDKAVVKQTISLSDGTVVKGGDGQTVELSVARQMLGLRKALQLLQKGGKGRFVVPSALAYSDRVYGKIPAGSLLVYDLELVDVLPDDAPTATPAQMRKLENSANNQLQIAPKGALGRKIIPQPLPPSAKLPKGAQ